MSECDVGPTRSPEAISKPLPFQSSKPRVDTGLGPARCPARSEGATTAVAQPTAMDKGLLLFWPSFVERAFQQHYSKNTVEPCDRVCLPLDAVIHVLCCCMVGMQPTLKQLLCTVPGLIFALAAAAVKYKLPDWYRRRRTAITVLRRLAILPFLSMWLRRPLHAVGSWEAAFLHLLVLSGSLHNLVAAFLFLNPWWSALPELAVAALVLAASAPTSCNNLLAGPEPTAGWKTAAALMDRAALNIYRSSLTQPAMTQAVCCTTLNTMLVVSSCLTAFVVHWYERQQQLDYKAQLPPAVAAMQSHLYGLPPGLVVAQAVLLLVHPALVTAWITLGAWYGLMTAAGSAAAAAAAAAGSS